MKKKMKFNLSDQINQPILRRFRSLINPVSDTALFSEDFIESRHQFSDGEVASVVRDFSETIVLFNKIIEKCNKPMIREQIFGDNDKFSLIRIVLQEIIKKDDDVALFRYKESMLSKYFELCNSVTVDPMFNLNNNARFYDHVQARFLNAIKRADLEVSSDLIKQGVDLDIRVNGAGDSLLTLLVKLRQKSLRECRASKEEAPRNNAVTYMKLLHQVLEKGVSLSTLLRDVTILDDLQLNANHLIAYFARSVVSPDEVLDALTHLKSKEDLKYLKGWLLQSLDTANVEYLFAIANNYLTMADNMVLIRILRTGRSSLEMKDTDSYVQFIDRMQKVQYENGVLLANVYREEQLKSVALYEAFLRELAQHDNSIIALRQRIIADDNRNLPAVLCYLMRATLVDLEPDQFQLLCVHVPPNVLDQPAVKACLTAAFASGAHRSLKANLIAYLEGNINNFRDELQAQVGLVQPNTWLFDLLNLRASQYERGNTPSYEKLRVMLDPDYKPENRWLRFTYRPTRQENPINVLELPPLNPN